LPVLLDFVGCSFGTGVSSLAIGFSSTFFPSICVASIFTSSSLVGSDYCFASAGASFSNRLLVMAVVILVVLAIPAPT